MNTRAEEKRKLSASELVHQALIWAEESIDYMAQCDKPRADELNDLRKQMTRYREKRFGKMDDPFKDAKLADAVTMRWPR